MGRNAHHLEMPDGMSGDPMKFAFRRAT